MKPRRRKLKVLGTLLVLALLAVGVGWFLFTRQPPELERFARLAPEAKAAAARRAEDQIVRTRELAVAAVTRPAGVVPAEGGVVTFTQDELNSVFEKWSALNGWRKTYERFITDPTIILRDDRLILAGRLKELGNAVASLHFEPRVTAGGQLDLGFRHMATGQLPLPASVYDKHLHRITELIGFKMPRWRESAEFTGSGTANKAAVSAGLGRLFTAGVDRRPSDAVLYLPLLTEPGGVPMRVSDVRVTDGAITLHVHPLTADERARVLADLKQPAPDPAPQTDRTAARVPS